MQGNRLLPCAFQMHRQSWLRPFLDLISQTTTIELAIWWEANWLQSCPCLNLTFAFFGSSSSLRQRNSKSWLKLILFCNLNDRFFVQIAIRIRFLSIGDDSIEPFHLFFRFDSDSTLPLLLLRSDSSSTGHTIASVHDLAQSFLLYHHLLHHSCVQPFPLITFIPLPNHFGLVHLYFPLLRPLLFDQKWRFQNLPSSSWPFCFAFCFPHYHDQPNPVKLRWSNATFFSNSHDVHAHFFRPILGCTCPILSRTRSMAQLSSQSRSPEISKICMYQIRPTPI